MTPVPLTVLLLIVGRPTPAPNLLVWKALVDDMERHEPVCDRAANNPCGQRKAHRPAPRPKPEIPRDGPKTLATLTAEVERCSPRGHVRERLVARFDVTPAGAAAHVEVYGAAPLQECVRNALGRARFGPAPSTTWRAVVVFPGIEAAVH